MIMITYVSCEYVGGLGDDGDYKYQSRYRDDWNEIFSKQLRFYSYFVFMKHRNCQLDAH